MKCQKCNVNNATTHIKTILNGELREYDLCSECAQKMGYTSLFGSMEGDFSNFLGSFFGNVLPARTQATRCEFCGSSYSEITKSGHVGCAKCYEIFADQLYPSINRIHGNTTHCGKNSKLKSNSEPTKADKLKKLKAELDKAISEQNFEYAAELRDKIREMEA